MQAWKSGVTHNRTIEIVCLDGTVLGFINAIIRACANVAMANNNGLWCV